MSFQKYKRHFLQNIKVINFQAPDFLGLNGPFKSAATTQNWTQKRCFPSFSDVLTMILGFLTLKNTPGCIYSQKGSFLALQIQIF